MAFVGAGRRAAAQRLLQAQTEAMMASYSDNAMFTREVGHPVALALQAFGDCNYDDTVRRLRSLGNADKAQSASHRPDKRRRNDVPDRALRAPRGRELMHELSRRDLLTWTAALTASAAMPQSAAAKNINLTLVFAAAPQGNLSRDAALLNPASRSLGLGEERRRGSPVPDAAAQDDSASGSQWRSQPIQLRMLYSNGTISVRASRK